MDLTSLDWRAGVLAAIALVAVYLVHTWFRLRRMDGQQASSPPQPPTPPVPAPAPVTPEPERPSAVIVTPAPAPEPPPEEIPPPSPPPTEFALRQFMRGVEGELEQLRDEVEALREEVAHLKTLHQTSPHYAEAMSMAGQGADPRSVAEQCGISLSEAELVLALARRHSPHRGD